MSLPGVVLDAVQVGQYIVRQLPPAEWDRLQTAPGPVQAIAGLDPTTDPAHFVVIEDLTGAIVGYWALFPAWHVEPLYMDVAVRHHPKVAMALIGAMTSLLQSLRIESAYAVVKDSVLPVNGPMAEALGFYREGTLFHFAVPPVSVEVPRGD